MARTFDEAAEVIYGGGKSSTTEPAEKTEKTEAARDDLLGRAEALYAGSSAGPGTKEPAPKPEPVEETEEEPVREAAQADEAEGAAPEATEPFELKGPDGPLPEGEAEVFSEAARHAGLDGPTAQKMLDKLAPNVREQQAEKLVELRRGWQQSIRDDPDLGGDSFDDTVATARRALAAVGDQELQDLLVGSGIGDHPAVIRMLRKVGVELGV